MIFVVDNSKSGVDLETIAEFVCKNCGLGFYTKTYMSSGTKTSEKVAVTSHETDALQDQIDKL